MTLRESIFVMLLEDHIKAVRSGGLGPDFENSTKVVRKRTKLVIDQLKKEGWEI